jgi:hypothetical protein
MRRIIIWTLRENLWECDGSGLGSHPVAGIALTFVFCSQSGKYTLLQHHLLPFGTNLHVSLCSKITLVLHIDILPVVAWLGCLLKRRRSSIGRILPCTDILSLKAVTPCSDHLWIFNKRLPSDETAVDIGRFYITVTSYGCIATRSEVDFVFVGYLTIPSISRLYGRRTHERFVESERIWV